MLPNTPMPKALMDLLHPEWIDEKSTSVTIGKGGVNVDLAGGGSGSNSGYNYATEDQVLHDNRNIAVYFLENDIKTGMKMKLRFTKSTNPATFLPRQVAESTPFTSNKMQEILNHFSVKPNSVEAEIMKKTIKRCEVPAMKGEEKETQVQKYSIAGAEKMVGEKAVVCHAQNYAYAVFYCHKLQKTKAYMVSLVGADGTKAKAVAVCHTDTSQWNPNHLAFQLLNLKPGKTVPICHYFLQEDQIVWFAT
ncbi:BURP domain protein RD22-like [Cornus florida]|uniref:BURP domain protein RD22-like n=1 Tax=Cornus florida TaxID=4283 RepID=UPI0028A072D1|nr:BURP domain protein RD22-like [Cornus florida]